MVRIREITNQNPWWKHGQMFFNYDRHYKEVKDAPVFIKRDFINTSVDNIFLIRGCRQIGKTTFIKDWILQLLNKKVPSRSILYLSVDFFTSRRELRNAITYFMDQNVQSEKIYIFLDEVTYLDDWNLEIKYLWDSGLASKAIIVITGSSGYELREKAEQLPGRGLEGNEYYMRALNFREFARYTLHKFMESNVGELQKSLEHVKDRLPHVYIESSFADDNLYDAVTSIAPYKEEIGYLFDKYLHTGGFPFVINSKLEGLMFPDREDITINDDIVDTFIRSISGDVNKRGLNDTISKRILRSVIEKYGSRYSFTNIAGEVGSSHVTVIDYLNFLERSFILSTLYPFDLTRGVVKEKGQKKVFFQDPFLYAAMNTYVTGISVNETYEEIMQSEELKSIIIEGIVHSHLQKNIEIPNINEGRSSIFYYYNTRGKEVDYLVRKHDETIGIEVKYKENVSANEINKHQNIDKYYILSKEDIEFKDNVSVIPIDIFLFLLKSSTHNL